MNSLIKALLIAFVLIVTGSLIFVGGVFILGGVQIPEADYETYTEKADDAITKIKIITDTTDIKVVVSDTTEQISIEYPMKKNKSGETINLINLTTYDGVLTLDERTPWNKTLFRFGGDTSKITLTIPKERVLSYDLECNTGDIVVENGLIANSVDLSVDTGKITLGSLLVAGGTVTATTDTGDINLVGNLATEHARFSVDTGKINIAAEIIANTLGIETDTGDIAISKTLTLAKTDIETDTGDINITGLLDSRIINVETDTGDVYIRLHGARELYSATIEIDTGKSNIKNGGIGERELKVSTNTGDVTVYFADKPMDII